MFLDQLMFKSSVSTHNFTVSRKMPARGLYRKLSETDRARALGCIDAEMRSRDFVQDTRQSTESCSATGSVDNLRIYPAQAGLGQQQGLQIVMSPPLLPETAL